MKRRTQEEVEANERRWRLRAEKLQDDVDHLTDCNSRQAQTIRDYQQKESEWWFERRRLKRIAGEPIEDAA